MRVDLVAFDGTQQNNLLRSVQCGIDEKKNIGYNLFEILICRYAKFWQKGISFMAKDVPLVYLVDEGGLRSSIDHFIHIRKDSVYDVFNE